MLRDAVEERAALSVDGEEQPLLVECEVRVGVERQQSVQAEADVGVSAAHRRSSALRPRLTLDGDIGARGDGARTPERAADALHGERSGQRSAAVDDASVPYILPAVLDHRRWPVHISNACNDCAKGVVWQSPAMR